MDTIHPRHRSRTQANPPRLPCLSVVRRSFYPDSEIGARPRTPVKEHFSLPIISDYRYISQVKISIFHSPPLVPAVVASPVSGETLRRGCSFAQITFGRAC